MSKREPEKSGKKIVNSETGEVLGTRHAPKKKRKSRVTSVILILIIVVAAAVFAFSGIQIYKIMSSYGESEDYYDTLSKVLYNEDETQTETETDEDGNVTVTVTEAFNWDWQAMLAINPDCIGYLRMVGDAEQRVDYPVVQGTDNSYYLDHLFDGTENGSGCLFADYQIEGAMNARYCIIYGHNMHGGSRMFASLKGYSDEAFFREHPEFDVYIGEKHYRYKVFAAYQTTIYDDVYNISFTTDEEFFALIEHAISNNTYDMGMSIEDFSSDSMVLLLSTCTDTNNETGRHVVLLVRDREIFDVN